MKPLTDSSWAELGVVVPDPQDRTEIIVLRDEVDVRLGVV